MHETPPCTHEPQSPRARLTFSAGYSVGAVGFARSQMQSSPSAAPEASRLGLNVLNSRPLTCIEQCGRTPGHCAPRSSKREELPDHKVTNATAPLSHLALVLLHLGQQRGSSIGLLLNNQGRVPQHHGPVREASRQQPMLRESSQP